MVVVVIAAPAWVDVMRRRGLRKPPDERLTCVEIKASKVLQLEIAESWLRVLDRASLGRQYKVSRHGLAAGYEMDPHFREARH
jgi:hypothetical protein